MPFLSSFDNLQKDTCIIFPKGVDNFEIEHKIWFFFFWISYFTWVFIQVLSPVLPWSPEPECTEQFDCRNGFSIAHMFWASHKQWEVAILTLINTSPSIKFRTVVMDDWLNLNKRPCWDLIRDPFASEANPWTAGLRYLWVKILSKECRYPLSLVYQKSWN